MTIRVYRQHCSVSTDRYAIEWAEYAFEPQSGGHRPSPRGWTHRRSAPEPIAVRVPTGAVLAELPTAAGDRVRRLVLTLGHPGIRAESVHRLAVRGEKGLSIERGEGEEVARRKDDGTPDLFGARAPATGDPVGRARALTAPARQATTAEAVPPWLRPRLHEIAAEVLAEARAEGMVAEQERIRELEGGARRALEQLVRATAEDADLAERARVCTARTILAGILEPAPAARGEG